MIATDIDFKISIWCYQYKVETSDKHMLLVHIITIFGTGVPHNRIFLLILFLDFKNIIKELD